MRIWRLFVGAKPTNTKGEYVLASWSYVTGYWRWVIFCRRPATWRDALRWPRVGPSMACGTKWFGYWGRVTALNAWASLPLIGTLSIQTQPPMPAMKKRHA